MSGLARALRAGLLVTALAAATLGPLFSAELFRSADGRNHLHRLVVMDQAWARGDFWPRYSPELAYGNGYPLFNYYAPLTYHLGVLLHRLGLPYLAAWYAVLGLAALTGAGGAYALARAWFGARGAPVAAAGWAFAPYLLFNLYARGAGPEAWGLALLPWLLWALTTLGPRPAGGALVRLAALVAALCLVHNLTALTGAALLGLWWGVEALTDRAPARSGWAALAMALGVGLAAPFWAPALLETGAVQVAQLTAPATLDFRNYFLGPAELLRPWFTFDPRLEPPAIPVAFGLAPAVLAVGALALAGRLPPPARRRLWLLGAVGALCLGLTVDASQPVWELVSPLKLFQFPWRLLGPASLCAALMAGALAEAVAAAPVTGWRRAGQRAFPFVAVGLTALLSLPWTFTTAHRADEVPIPPAITDIFAHEVGWGVLGLTATGEFLPAGVRVVPPPDADFARAAAEGRAARVLGAAPPDTAQVLSAKSAPLWAEARLAASAPVEAVFRWFYFPGWQAQVDGQPAPVRAVGEAGWVGVTVPAGEHTVRVFFGDTPLRQWAWAVAALCVTGLAWLAGRRGAPIGEAAARPSARLGRWAWLAWCALGLGVGAWRWAIAEAETPWRRSPFDGVIVAGVAQPMDLVFGGQLRLVGVTPPAAGPQPADRPLAFTLYWAPMTALTENFSVAVQVWDAEGHLVGQQDAWQPGGAETRRWRPEGYAVDTHALTVFPGTAPGEYRLMVGVYPTAGGGTVEVRAADGVLLGRWWEAARVRLAPPTQPPAADALAPAHPLNTPLGALTVLGVDGLGGEAQAGDPVSLVVYWRGAQPGAQVQLLLGGVSEPVWTGPLPLALTAESVTRWPLTFTLPPEAAAGAQPLSARLVNAAGAPVAGPQRLGELQVRAPERVFEAPAIAQPRPALFDAKLSLLGYALTTEAEAWAVTLYWRAEARMTTRYAVSVQVLDAAGQIVAQADGEPGAGARPTTGWLPPEVITDPHRVARPAGLTPGAYAIQVVVYDPRTGARLPVAAADQPPGEAARLQGLEVGQ